MYQSDPDWALHLASGAESRGAQLENFMACDLFTLRETTPRIPNMLFCRTNKGAEVDVVVETPRELIPVRSKVARWSAYRTHAT